jgi:hypothetical protein
MRSKPMKSFGNLILMTLICIIIFWVFMALRPAHAVTAKLYAPDTAPPTGSDTNIMQ